MSKLRSISGLYSKKVAAILALLLGVMSVFAGSKVLLEIDTKDYNILVWLVIYNVIFGAISIVVFYYIWKKSAIAKGLSLFILAMHLSVFLYLKFVSTTVASESIKAMFFRTSVWVVVIVLSVFVPFILSKKE